MEAAVQAFMTAWLRDNLDFDNAMVVSELASQCEAHARAAGFSRAQIERDLGATIEEAIMVATDAARLDRQ
ncbi:MAG: hypothetical protein KF723_19785 [Rhizobiaceae bacterium]|nr:hypothetical protein [Rhizobiaceae bacterium]